MDKPETVQVVIDSIPYDEYLKIRKHYSSKGIHVQAYQKNYYQDLFNRKIE